LRIAKWQARDPLPNAETKQGLNLYQYVHNRPINLNDPRGELSPWTVVTWGTVAVLIGQEVIPPIIAAIKKHKNSCQNNNSNDQPWDALNHDNDMSGDPPEMRQDLREIAP
jgi:hypothetical protein